MKLKDYVYNFRKEHDMSQRQFAIHCGLSHGAVSLIEKEINPKTGEKLTPTLAVLKKLAKGMNITLTELMANVDDMPIDISEEARLNKREEKLLDRFRELNEEGQERLIDEADMMIASGMYKKMSSDSTGTEGV